MYSYECSLSLSPPPLLSSDIDEVEATYMRRRFQGLSLEEQRRMAEKDKHKKKKSERIHTRRSSSATESSKSSVKLSPYSRRAKIRKGNPFGLQVHVDPPLSPLQIMYSSAHYQLCIFSTSCFFSSNRTGNLR